MDKFYKIFLLIVFVSLSTNNAQDLKCNYCKEPITGEYITVDGFSYHKEHFKCTSCNKPINGKYYSKDGKYYDEQCYEKLFMPKCAVCNQPIKGEYLIDSYGQKIHKSCQVEVNKCDNCNRIISQNTTNGGVKYSDGRNICNICYGKKLNSIDDYNNSLNNVIKRLGNYGLKFNKPTIILKIVNLTELQKISGNSYSKSINGFTHSKIETIGSKKSFEHTVYILSAIPAKYAESTIAHELMHIWISENIDHKLSPQLEEGSCNYISYIYLKSDYSQDSKDIIKLLEENPDKVYGDGYKKVFQKFNGWEFNLLLDYLKKNRSI